MIDLLQFLAERNQALRKLDENYVARSLPTAPPELRLMILHKARYECTAIEPELRHQSGRWLSERNLSRSTGDPILPDGALPK